MGVNVDFCLLAMDTLSGPVTDVQCQRIPKEMKGNVPAGDPDISMTKGICSNICLQKERGIRGQKGGVKTLPRSETVGEKGVDMMERGGLF
jgi:hypothetical protein